MRVYQVTLVAKNGKYKPVSALVNREHGMDIDAIRKKGIEKICLKRYWTMADLKKYTYTSCKVREYDKEKIDKENAERYNKIKEQKYSTGEWKRPKGETK